MALKPWYTVVTPREDLREGKPLDASEFAVHLDKVRDGTAPPVYANPAQFFERTFLTQTLATLGGDVIRRLSGVHVETSAVFNLMTQFGGGKTHALTLLYHLAQGGRAAVSWPGVPDLLARAGVSAVPGAAVAVFVGTEFDSLDGRGGADGTPPRRTPWGEIAWQLGGAKGLAAVAQHDLEGIAPGGDVIRQMLPADRPFLILMDELMNYVTRNRRSGLAGQLYAFMHNLSETVRGMEQGVLAVSIPASELEMSAEDQGDYDRFKKLLDRLGKAMILSAETETAEIIRRRLFEWDLRALTQGGRVLLPKEAMATCGDYATWAVEHRQQLPTWFPVDRGAETFVQTYPFHPVVLSVFERKWNALPRFQQTRGVLRMLAQWVADAYRAGYKGAQHEELITLGTAPLNDTLFRAAIFEQLGEGRAETVVTTDIEGTPTAHAVRLDREAPEAIQKARLHRKVATAIFFESNGGAIRAEATVPEIRLAVAGPGTEIGSVEGAVEALQEACYYLEVDKNRYRFSLKPNLNKILADRRASVPRQAIEERVRAAVENEFKGGPAVDRIFFPEKSNNIPDRPALVLAVWPPDESLHGDGQTVARIDQFTREYGASSRQFKNALVWCVPEATTSLYEAARKLLAWEAIRDEAPELQLSDQQQVQIPENLKKAERDLRESVWRAYNHLALLGKDNQVHDLDLGHIHSSSANSLVELILSSLEQRDALTGAVSPAFLVRNWPPAFKEWSTKAVRDAFFASPLFPRLLRPDVLKDTIGRGVSQGVLAYVGQGPDGRYQPFYYINEPGRTNLTNREVDLPSDDMFIITAEAAEAYIRELERPQPAITDVPAVLEPPVGPAPPPSLVARGTPDPRIGERTGTGYKPTDDTIAPITPAGRVGITWTGALPYQKWSLFYMKLLTKLAQTGALELDVTVRAAADSDRAQHLVEELRTALRELGLEEHIELKPE